MTQHHPITARLMLIVACAALALAAVACGGKKNTIPTGIAEADKFLFERGTDALNRKKWLTAREFFGRLVDNYPQSPHRPDAKIGLGDSYLGEGGVESLVLAVNEFKEFLSFYPTHRRADYAQYKLALCHYQQMRGPERDQRETREAVIEFETFFAKYPNSDLMPEVRERYREARDRLSTSEYRVGYFYFRQKWYPGAISRFQTVLKEDPGYSNRDALYYYLGESLLKVKRDAEALPYFDRLVKEFETSEYLEKARARLAEFKETAPGLAPAASGSGTSPGGVPSSPPVTPVSTPPASPPTSPPPTTPPSTPPPTSPPSATTVPATSPPADAHGYRPPSGTVHL
jgi:outer membrane protein assembly factor BamD